MALCFGTPKNSYTEHSCSKAHAVLIKNFFSTAVKSQFAVKLKVLFTKTSFQRKNHCLKGRQAVSLILVSELRLVWATRIDVQLHT